MKKLLLSALLAGLTAGAYAQGAGTVLLNNNQNTGGAAATSSGLIFLNGSPTTVDLNVALFGFTDSASVLSHPVASLTGAAANGDALGGSFPGTFTDLSATAYAVDGTTTASTTGAFFILQAWIGNDSTYAAAVAAGHAAGQTTVFVNGLGGVGSPPSTPPGLDSMPSLALTAGATPEPSTFPLAGLGAAALLIFRRRK